MFFLSTAINHQIEKSNNADSVWMFSNWSRYRDRTPKQLVTLATPKLLMEIPTYKSNKWNLCQDLYEDWFNNYQLVSGWSRIIGGDRVLILFNRCGELKHSWRMYLNGEMVNLFTTFNSSFETSSNEAKSKALKFMRTKKNRTKLKFQKYIDQFEGKLMQFVDEMFARETKS